MAFQEVFKNCLDTLNGTSVAVFLKIPVAPSASVFPNNLTLD